MPETLDRYDLRFEVGPSLTLRLGHLPLKVVLHAGKPGELIIIPPLYRPLRRQITVIQPRPSEFILEGFTRHGLMTLVNEVCIFVPPSLQLVTAVRCPMVVASGPEFPVELDGASFIRFG